MGKRRSRSDANDHRSGACAGGEAKRPRPEQKHLYLALDDWEKGYNLYKVDVHAIGSADTEAESQLPEPPVLQLEAAKGARDVLFAAAGTDILALWQPRYETSRLRHGHGAAGRRRPSPPEGAAAHALRRRVVRRRPRAVRAARRRHALPGAPRRRRGDDRAAVDVEHGLLVAAPAVRRHAARLAAPHHENNLLRHASRRAHRLRVRHEWQAPRHVLLLPRRRQRVDAPRRLAAAVPWPGPLRRQAAAWVGLHSPGHVCTCDVPSTTFSSVAAATSQPPAWQLVSAEHLFQEDHPELGGTSLVSTGDAEFCIVESVTPKWMDPVWDRDEIDEYVLRVTRFRLKHDRHGQLRASSRCRRASYRVRKHDSVFAPQAFWL
uniref:Uncharacterized protein n=1 Tax=Oryza meridionalis TaxID=40149 RepID=A0A0E0CXM4_9ORYZ